MYENIYYSPEKFGVVQVGSFDFTEPDYSFDMCVVWKDESGQFWVGTDSGCSCPSPFEDIKDINELDGPYTKEGLKSRLTYLAKERGDDSWGLSVATLKKSVAEVMRNI